MGRSNTANGGTTYYDLDIQVVATSPSSYTLRAVIYLTSFNVIDSVNTLSVSGNWSRGGALALNGVYSATPVWSQDIVVGLVVGVPQTVTVNASWATVEYWGVTLSASASYTVPAAANPVTAPSAPIIGLGAVTQNTAVVHVNPPASTGGAAIDLYAVYVMTNNAFPGSGGNVVASWTGGTGTATGLLPLTTYYYTAVCHNNGGFYSPYASMGVFTTKESAWVKVGGAWRPAAGYVKVAGVWRPIAQTSVKVAGAWRSW